VIVESMPMSPRVDDTVCLWDLQTGREVRKWKLATFFVSSIAFSPDGRYAACSTYSNTRIWETSTWNEIRKWTGALKGPSSTGVRSLSFSQDGQLILTGKGWPDNSVCLFEVNGGHQIQQFKGHTARVNGVALSADGKYALSGSDDGVLILWNTDSGTENCRFVGHSERVNSVALSKNNSYAISGSDDGTLRLWPLPESTATQPILKAPPSYEAQPPPLTYPCPNCGQPLEYYPEYQKWYCENCKEYS
jgi:WD40 repeat protein